MSSLSAATPVSATAGPTEYNITVPATLSWVMLVEYDNRTNDGSITETLSYQIEETISRTEFEKDFNSTARTQLKDQKVSTEVGATYEGINATIKGELTVSDEIKDVVEHTTETTVKTDYHKEQKYERKSESISRLVRARDGLLTILDFALQSRSRRRATSPCGSSSSPRRA